MFSKFAFVHRPSVVRMLANTSHSKVVGSVMETIPVQRRLVVAPFISLTSHVSFTKPDVPSFKVKRIPKIASFAPRFMICPENWTYFGIFGFGWLSAKVVRLASKAFASLRQWLDGSERVVGLTS